MKTFRNYLKEIFKSRACDFSCVHDLVNTEMKLREVIINDILFTLR